MKKLSLLFIAILILVVASDLQAQEKSENKNIRTISVSGVAEKEILYVPPSFGTSDSAPGEKVNLPVELFN